MSKYDDLWRTHEEERQKHEEYTKWCVQFGTDLFKKFIAYIECPEDRIRFYPFDRKSKGERSPLHASTFGDDGRVGTCAVLELGPPPSPGVVQMGGLVPMEIPTYFSRKGEQFTVQSATGETYVLSSADDPKAESYFDDVIRQIEQHLRESYMLSAVPQRIGFHRPPE